MKIILAFAAGLILTACGSPLDVNNDDQLMASICATSIGIVDSEQFLSGFTQLSDNGQTENEIRENAQDKIQSSKAEVIKSCGQLSDPALKALFLGHMSKDMNVEALDILEEKIVKFDRGIGGRKYVGKANTLRGKIAFSGHISEDADIVVKLAEVFD